MGCRTHAPCQPPNPPSRPCSQPCSRQSPPPPIPQRLQRDRWSGCALAPRVRCTRPPPPSQRRGPCCRFASGRRCERAAGPQTGTTPTRPAARQRGRKPRQMPAPAARPVSTTCPTSSAACRRWRPASARAGPPAAAKAASERGEGAASGHMTQPPLAARRAARHTHVAPTDVRDVRQPCSLRRATAHLRPTERIQ